MTAKEFNNFILDEVKEGKTDTQIIEKLLRIEGFEQTIDLIKEIRENRNRG